MRATVGEEVFGCRQRGLLASTQLNARMLSPELASESQGRHAKRAVIQRGRKIDAEQRIRAQALRFNAGRKLGQIQKITGIQILYSLTLAEVVARCLCFGLPGNLEFQRRKYMVGFQLSPLKAI